ncbi:MAG: coproporphyrinogen III oxidase family protein, partial [Anaerolineae bacterium]|nr:coproporphyrinogen III oxidase family protein [Anaerolineae bacterium]
YWRNEAYLGFGPGAHSSLEGRRWAAIKPVPAYIERVNRGESVLDFVEEIDERLAMGETMMLGLRLVHEGVAFERFQQRHGRSMLDVFGDEIADLERMGLLERLPDRVRLTRPARLLGNQVFVHFLP